MASTLDLRVGSAAKPSEGIDRHYVIKKRIDSSDLSKYNSALAALANLVSGNTYKYADIPANTILIRAMIVVKSADGSTGTSTLTDGSIVPLAAQVMNAKGAFAGVTNLPKWYEAAGIISGLIATNDITTAIFEVVLELIDLN